jgi:hypothetical protein
VTKAEQETILRWDQSDRVAHLWTAYQPDARRWEDAGYSVSIASRAPDGEPVAWKSEVPFEAIRYRKVENGLVRKRQGHGKGRHFGDVHDQIVELQRRNADGACLGLQRHEESASADQLIAMEV